MDFEDLQDEISVETFLAFMKDCYGGGNSQNSSILAKKFEIQSEPIESKSSSLLFFLKVVLPRKTSF